MRIFEFVFCIHLMRDILGLIFELSQALQKKDQDIVNAIGLVASLPACFNLSDCFRHLI